MHFVTYFKLLTIAFVGLVWICVVAFLRLRKKKDLVYLFFFTIFFVYAAEVLDYTLFQFQSLLLLKHFMPGLMLRGETAAESVNLIPLVTLTRGDLRTSLLNILLMIPFGFGLPFITELRMKKVVVAGMLCSIGIEVLQLATGLLGKVTFRVADINDVIFNTLGAAIGYLLCVGFLRLYRSILRDGATAANPILRYIAQRPQARSERA